MHRAIVFFRIVPPVPPLMTSTFVVITLVSAVVVIVDPLRATGVLLAIGLLQLFASASGFSGAARRGYYDLLLTRGDRRLHIAVAQWLMSVAAGLASWIAIAGVETAATGSPAHSLAHGTIVAMILVSTIPWASTVALPRFAGAVGWLLVMVLASTLWPDMATAPSAVVRAAAVLLLPGALVGVDVPGGLPLAGPALVCAMLAMVTAVWWIERADFPLEAAQ